MLSGGFERGRKLANLANRLFSNPVGLLAALEIAFSCYVLTCGDFTTIT